MNQHTPSHEKIQTTFRLEIIMLDCAGNRPDGKLPLKQLKMLTTRGKIEFQNKKSRKKPGQNQVFCAINFRSSKLNGQNGEPPPSPPERCPSTRRLSQHLA
jgi:hypothetical protein